MVINTASSLRDAELFKRLIFLLSEEDCVEGAVRFLSCEDVEARASAKVVAISHLKSFLFCLNFWLNKY